MTAPRKAKGRSRARRAGQRASSTPPALRRRPRSKALLALGAFGLSVALAIAALLVWATRTGPDGADVTEARFTGQETATEVAERLRHLGLVSSPRIFSLYLRAFAIGVELAPGTHLLKGGLTPRELVQRLGRLSSRPSTQVVLPEGISHRQIGERLEQREICFNRDFAAAVRSSALLADLGLPGMSSAEGYLFPATYQLNVDSDAEAVVRQLVNETRKRLARIETRAPGAMQRVTERRGWTEREVLTLASIVERETGVAEERPLVASVFLNRLDDPAFRPARMLQSDPTAAYGCVVAREAAPSCASFNGKVTPEMLRDARNVYNTYRHAGLPPGPIGNPGEAAIRAVLEPAASDFLYFVADGHGRHRFSRTFEEHRRAIRSAEP